MINHKRISFINRINENKNSFYVYLFGLKIRKLCPIIIKYYLVKYLVEIVGDILIIIINMIKWCKNNVCILIRSLYRVVYKSWSGKNQSSIEKSENWMLWIFFKEITFK